MKDTYVNRLSMFQSALDTLHAPEHQAVWFERNPAIFGTKLDRTAESVAELAAFCREQERDIRGAAEQKRREGAELEEAVHVTASSLAIWFRDRGEESRAAEVDLTRSQWQYLRDQQFIEKCRLIRSQAQAVLEGPNAAEAANYGISADSLQSLSRAIDEYASVITAPQQSVADRKARTEQLRDRFNAVELQFEVLDRLILHFGGTSAGRNLIAAYQAARIIRDLGGRPNRSPTADSPALAAS